MASEFAYQKLTISAVTNFLPGMYTFGVVVDGAFIALAHVKQGLVLKQIELAKAKTASKRASASK